MCHLSYKLLIDFIKIINIKKILLSFSTCFHTQKYIDG